VALIRHDARKVNKHGVQNCRRCGIVLTDLAIPGQARFDTEEVYFAKDATGSGYFMAPDYFTAGQRRDAVLCNWNIH
jgi:hypothetical protein